jgi:hypothetical protein
MQATLIASDERGDTVITGAGNGEISTKPARSAIKRSPALEKALLEVWAEIASLTEERLVVLDKDGNRIHEKDGTADSVPIMPEDAAKMRGEASIHNHPDDDGMEGLPTTFSVADLDVAIKLEQSEASVCNPLMIASFQPLPASKLGRWVVRLQFLRPLKKARKWMYRDLAATVKLFRKGNINREEAIQEQRFIVERWTNKARDHLCGNQDRFNYIYEERAMGK